MANETVVQTSCIQENPEADESRENIPPGVTAAAVTSKLKVPVGDVGGCPSSQPSGENEPLSDTFTFSTPAPVRSHGGAQAKSRLQSALTPILKYLNIGGKCPSPETLKHGNNPHLTVPTGNTAAYCHKTTGGSSQHPNLATLSDTNPPVRWLIDETLPEVSFLDVTCDSTMQLTTNDVALPDSMPSTPVTAGSVRSSSAGKAGGSCDVQDLTLERHPLQKPCGSTVSGEASTTTVCLQKDTFKTRRPSKQNGTITVTETSSSESHQTTMDKPSPPKVCNVKETPPQVPSPGLSKYNGPVASKDPHTKMIDIPENIDAPLCWLDDRFLPQITLLDVTCESESTGMEMSSLEVTQDISSVDSLQNIVPSSVDSGQIVSESGTLDMIQSGDLSSTLDGNATISSVSERSKCVDENTPKALSSEVTRDISMGSVLEDSGPSLELSGQSAAKIQTPVEGTLDTYPANVTHDISSSSDMSVQCASPRLATSDVQCDPSSKNVTSELRDSVASSNTTVEADNEEIPASREEEVTSKVSQQSPKTDGSVNGTFTIAEQSSLSVSTSVNTANQIPCPQNRTLDLPPSDVSSPKVESDAKNEATSVPENTTDIGSPVVHENSSAVKASGSCDLQNVTFDRNSLQKSSGSTVLGEAGTFCVQNNTFDAKSSKQNGTITLSETSSGDSHQGILDRSSPPKLCNATSSPKDNKSEVHPPEPSTHNGTTASVNPDAKTVDTPESTFEANPTVEVASGAGQSETKDHSQSGLPVTDGLSDSLGHQSVDVEDNKANTLNLDDTLDLRADALITSTPMTNCKLFNFHAEREEGQTAAVQKKLYGDGPSKPSGQVQSEAPSNIVCDRKTFLTQPAAKSLLPPSKAAPQPSKCKPASKLPGRFEPLRPGLPMTRQRTQAEALRNTAAADAPQVSSGTSTTYNLRATTTGTKQTSPGLRAPRLSGIPSGIQRAASGLKPPSGRGNAPAISSTDKLRGPTATNPTMKIPQAKKHPLTRGEPLPIAKRKKMDAPLPSGSTEAPASSCDAANRAKSLKQSATSQRSLPTKTQRADAAVPATTAETSTSCSVVNRPRALKQPITSHRAVLPKPQDHGCAECVVLKQQLELKSQEIRRLKEELLKYTKPEEEC